MRQRPANSDTSGSDIDRLLTDFFRADVPEPWPTLKAPTGEVASEPMPLLVVAPPRKVSSNRARWVLAASVGLLALAGALLTQRTPMPPRDKMHSLDNAIAKPGEHLLPEKKQ